MGRRSGWAPWRRSTAASLRAEFALLIGFLLVVGLLRFLSNVVLAGQLEERSRSVTAAAGTVITITLPACPVDRRGEPAGRHAAPI